MLGWFAPKCPVDTQEKAWTETRMHWLAERFGIDRLLQAEVILPTEQFFPDPYQGTPDDVRDFFVRLCGYMEIDPQSLDLEIRPNEELPGASGQYQTGERALIRVAESELAEPQRLLAVLAHELAHELLLGGGLLAPNVPDHEWITDLLPVYLGVGVFAANSVVTEQYETTGNWHWWSVGKLGYLPPRVFGYALALFAFLRDEPVPAWAEHLRLDVYSALKVGLRYLQKTNDLLFRPDTIRKAGGPLSVGELANRLTTGSASFRLAALWEIQERNLTAAELLGPVRTCLNQSDRYIPGEAARTLPVFGAGAESAVPQLCDALHDTCPQTRAGAAYALGKLRPPAETVIPELHWLLKDGNKEVVQEACFALRAFGPNAAPAVPSLLEIYRAALIKGDQPLIEVLAGTLLAAAPDPKRSVFRHFSQDVDLRRLALEVLQEQQDETEGEK